MTWQALKIAANAHTADILGDALMELGALSVSIEDAHAGTAEEQEIFGEPGEPPAGVWQDALVNALFEADADLVTIVAEASAVAGLSDAPAFEVETVAEQDWVRQTQAQFAPIPISPRLWIVPTWHEFPDVSAINLILDPGLAFGTGSHPTTRLCLQWLDRHIRGGETVLDYGCGSGILAIAAMKLGAGQVVGVDIDQQAIQASQFNAEQNQVAASFYLPNDAPQITVDIVVANILTNPLKMLAPMLANAARPGGRIVLSGILSHQADDVLAVYRSWFDIDIADESEGWVCLAGTRKA
ncbi:MAG: 50S ribosomal protein L11 methyltransferase [Gammaproteobacteria bacterium]|nr:50S ribosomal protein L11 methyltransferase [Gammaproteobacteria bacterium]MBU1732125.1 50S ribosomal protein L11 methyltransferase [Gammaproteobacteria bacterium]MBU1893345.1 50S ribosomal protein L11 methyltransferase [Gammaproteobacteria bacterium]